MPHPNTNKTKIQIQSSADRIITLAALPIKGKKKQPKKNSAQISPYKKLTQTTGPTFSSVQFSSVAQLCLTLCDPMNCSTLGLPVEGGELPKSTQTHVHWVGNAIQASHPLLSPSPPALNLSQHQGLFQWVSSSHQVAKVLEFQLQHQFFQWTPRTERILAYLLLSYSRSSWKPTLSTVSSNCLAQTLISSISSLPSWSSPLLPLTWIIAVAFYHNFLFFFFSLSGSFLYNSIWFLLCLRKEGFAVLGQSLYKSFF